MNKLKRIFSNPDIIKRLAFTFLILLVFKLGTYIPVPLIDTNSIKQVLKGNDFLTILNTFSGGGLSSFSVLALGISPYITSSIIVQMLGMIIPSMKEWQEMGEQGKAKSNRITRYITIAVAMIQALALLFSLGSRPENILANSALAFGATWFLYIYMAIVITAGSAFTMWLADIITKHGIGNGSSMIICAGIVSSIPNMFSTLYSSYLGSAFSGANLAKYITVVVLYVAMIVAVVYFEAAKRKIPVQYANRQSNENSDIPVKLNSAGVIPVIFASTLMSIPLTIVGMLGYTTTSSNVAYWLDQVFSSSKPIGMALYIIMIFFFSYFYSFLTIDPEKIGDNLSKQNAFIPGYKPGEDTKRQIAKVLFRVTTIGAIGLAILALVPIIVSMIFGLGSTVTVGGTSLLIIVGVAIETFNQIEAESENDSYSKLIS
ncbi:MAG TPA: preprotein translocase subunit SecY [Acholeplasmatales bacterium]|nr:protein translocase subunit SecY [Clostridium sp. CAG:307]HCS25777.1 preprotein translocase subunit SecY [Acholeplasmatales bacterium]